MTTPTKWVSPHRQGAMELNPDMVQKIDDEIEFELDTMPDTDIVRHWMFSDESYRKALADLIIAVRRVQIDLRIPATLTDVQIAGKLLRNYGFWTVPGPTTAWEKTCVLSRFLATYATIFMKARKTVRNERLHMRQQSARAHT